MKYPTLTEINTSREWTDEFLGYNHNLRIGRGEFYDMKNMTGDSYPILSPRAHRGVKISNLKDPTGIIAKDALCYIDGADLYVNEYQVPLKLTVEYGKDGKMLPKKLISMGAYIIVLPDKKYVNTASIGKDSEKYDFGDIEKHFISTQKSDGKMAFFTPSLMDGAKITVIPSYTAPPVTDVSKEIPYWYDISNGVLKLYSLSDEIWTTVSTTYVKIESGGIGKGFSVGDSVTISGVVAEGCESLNATATIASLDDDFIVVPGIITPVAGGDGLATLPSQETPIVVSRWMPELDFICESQNRLWGCRYGEAYQGMRYDGKGGMAEYHAPVVNEIYSCKLGDFKNWNTFSGIASDSYAVTLGTDGHFTGAVTYLGYPMFFKENYIHKIYGSFPSNFQVQTTACRGVQKGCDRSIAIVNEVLYYKSQAGIMGYDGSLPIEVSAALGDKVYSDARAGCLGNKYFVSMKDESALADEDPSNDYSLFVYDTKRGTWHREDNTEAVMFANCRGNLYFIDYGTNQIHSVAYRSDDAAEESDFDWYAVTGLIGTDTPDKKYISRLDIRMKVSPGASVRISAEYDSCGEWEFLYNATGRDIKSFSVPVKPIRCDHMRLKFEGRGDAKIFSICKNVEWGSDK